jgi:D-3-phosphoglycerate dehydrogenase
MVVNAPQSNIVSAAEQAVALLLACARNLAPANAALKSGRWERSRWTGVEVADKVVGVVGPRPHRRALRPAMSRSAPS